MALMKEGTKNRKENRTKYSTERTKREKELVVTLEKLI